MEKESKRSLIARQAREVIIESSIWIIDEDVDELGEDLPMVRSLLRFELARIVTESSGQIEICNKIANWENRRIDAFNNRGNNGKRNILPLDVVHVRKYAQDIFYQVLEAKLINEGDDLADELSKGQNPLISKVYGFAFSLLPYIPKLW